MIKIGKKNVVLIVLFVAILFAAISFCTGFSYITYADADYTVEQVGSNDYLLEKYTDTDKLTNENGDEISKTIFDFANEVKGKNDYTEVTDLTKVIPVKYVRFIENGYTFQYSGKEYGFFVNHRIFRNYQLVDVVLFDFEYSYKDIYCSARIDLLLQETFKYKNNNGTDSWFRCDITEGEKDYYIVNPRFVSAIQNENALNFGDNGYTKKKDAGAIIQQATLNFEGINIIKDGFTQEEMSLTVQSAFCGVIDNVIGLIPYVGTAYGIITSVNDFILTLSDSLDYKIATIGQGSDGEVLYKSRGLQEQEPENISFSRSLVTAPTNEILLTDNSSSYIKCNTVLDDSKSRTRIVQCIQFDILQTKGDEPDTLKKFMNQVDDDGNLIPFATYQEKVLFEGQIQEFEVSEDNVEGANVPVYMLPYGNQKISFVPAFSGNYSFNIPSGAEISIDNATLDNNVSYLKGETKYIITLTNISSQKVIAGISCALTDILYSGINNIAIEGNTKQVFKIVPNNDGYYEITVDNSNVSIYSGGTTLTENSGYALFENGIPTYLVFENHSAQSINCRITISSPQSVSINSQQSFSAGKYIKAFSNENDYDIKYNLLFDGTSGAFISLQIFNDQGDIKSSYAIINGVPTYTFVLEANQNCYIIFNLGGQCSFKIIEDESQWRWVVNGEATINNIIDLPRAESYNIYLGWEDLDGSIVKTKSNYLTDFDYPQYVSYNENGDLIINYGMPVEKVNGEKVKLFISPQPEGPSLTVNVVKNLYRDFTLDKNGGNGGYNTVTVEVGQPLNLGSAPTRTGYTFNGYYTSKDCINLQNSYTGFRYKDGGGNMYVFNSNSTIPKPSFIDGGAGKRYFNYDMSIAVDVKQMSNAVLYACWVPNRYTVTIDKSGGTDCCDYFYAFYQCRISNFNSPELDGYYYDHCEDPYGKQYFNYGPGMSMGPSSYVYTLTEDTVFTVYWGTLNALYPELSIVGKSGGTWSIRITNNTALKITVNYNAKMCNFNDAKNWTGLYDVNQIELEPHESVVVNISENWFATSIAVSWNIPLVGRCVTYANGLNTNGSMNIYHNII